MILSPKYKRFKRINFTGDTFTLLDMRSSIIRNLQRCNQQQNTTNLWRLKKQTQIIEIWIQNTDRILTVYDRAYHPLPYADTVIISGHPARPDVSRPDVSRPDVSRPDVSRPSVFKKPKTYLNNEMIPILVYYSYATKYHKLTSMFVPGYQCSNIYINVEKGALMNKDIQ